MEHFTGVRHAKAIINLNPAEPPINMHNTLYMETSCEPDMGAIKKNVAAVVEKMKCYVPGVHIVAGPIFEGDRVTVITSVIGAGDFLPKYAGNLDIMTCAAVTVAEAYAKKMKGKRASV